MRPLWLVGFPGLLALTTLSLLLLSGEARPHPKDKRFSASWPSGNSRLLRHHVQREGPSGRLMTRGRDGSGHMIEMKYLQFKALAAIIPIAPAAQALYVCLTPHLPPIRAFSGVVAP